MSSRPSTVRLRWLGVALAAVGIAAVAAGAVGAASTAAPVNTKEPWITGSPLVGKQLTGDRGDWSGTGITYAYKWLRCDTNGAGCKDIAGAKSTTYDLVSADLGHTIRFEVTASNADGKTTRDSNATAVIANTSGVPASTSPPTISGSPTVGSTLTGGAGSWIGDQPITFTYQWQRCDTNGNGCKNIGGATKSTYTVAQGDSGATLRFKVTAKNARGKTSAISVQSAVVTAGGGGGGGGPAVDVKDVPKGERLIVDSVKFSPTTVTTRSQPIVVTITVKDTQGHLVRNAYVFFRSTPIVTNTPTDAQTDSNGKVTYSVMPESDFPIKTGYAVQFYVKAYRKGDPTLAGISGSRLVQVPTKKP